MAQGTTKLAQLVNPEVMADMVNAKLPKKIVLAPVAKIDDTLQGRAGNTITIPSWEYVGPAEDVAEGVECDITQMASSTKTETIKKAMKAIELTDEAVLSGYGNPVGEATSQLAKSIADKIDADCMDELLTATLTKTNATIIGYDGIVDSIDVFGEEINSEKLMFVHPNQVSQLRKDDEFKSSDTYNGQVVMSGEIGRIANTRIVPSKRVTEEGNYYVNPIIKLNNDAETEDDAAALTIFMKKGITMETERNTLARKTVFSIDQHYGVALTNEDKVVLAKFLKVASV